MHGGKRLFDLAVSLTALAVTLPLIVIAAIAIKLNSRGPLFYADPRVGQHGRPFRLLKLRSMVEDASAIGWNITVDGDPRITRVGRFLRKWKIDELPNFINVLRGEMSVVGPRPEVPEYIRYYTPDQERVLSVRPGITDMATSGAYRDEQQILACAADPRRYYIDVVMPDKLRLNLRYVDRPWSIKNDVRIIAATVTRIAEVAGRPSDPLVVAVERRDVPTNWPARRP